MGLQYSCVGCEGEGVGHIAKVELGVVLPGVVQCSGLSFGGVGRSGTDPFLA